jgi:hypothetical protein
MVQVAYRREVGLVGSHLLQKACRKSIQGRGVYPARSCLPVGFDYLVEVGVGIAELAAVLLLGSGSLGLLDDPELVLSGGEGGGELADFI